MSHPFGKRLGSIRFIAVEERTLKSFTSRAAKARLGEIVRRCRDERVEITRFGRRAAVVLSPSSFALYERAAELLRSLDGPTLASPAKSYATRQAKARMGEIVRQCRAAPVELTRFGRRSAVFVSAADFATYDRFADLVSEQVLLCTVEAAADDMAAGRKTPAAVSLRSLAPYWRRVGIKGAPRARTAPRKKDRR